MYDAIVIGSRCAGAPTAMLLARAGRRVLVVDRATFPSDVLSGHTIQPAGVARLQRWGLLDKVRATGVPFTPKVRFDFGPVVLEGEPTPVDGISDAVCIRRTIFDTLLTAEAADAGAEVRQGFTVQELLWEDGRVVGIRGRDATGATVEERAHIVIGADGARSFVARAGGCAHLQRGARHHRQRLLLLPGPRPRRHRALRAAGPVLRGHAHQRRPRLREPDRARPRGRPLPGPHGRRLRRDGRRGPPPGRAAGRTPSASSASGGRRPATGSSACPPAPAGRWSATPATTSTRSPPRGCSTRFRDAELLAAAVDRGLSGDLSEELLGYQRARDTAAMPMYEHTANLANVEVPPPPEMQALIGLLAGNAHQTSRFLGLIAGSVPIPEFFSPESLAAIEAEAQAPAA